MEFPYIARDLWPLAVPCEQLILDPANARSHPEPNLEGIQASLRAYGQRKPIVVNRRTMIVEAGNGALESARALGWSHIAAVMVDDDPMTATGFAIADNRTAELAEWDEATLQKLLGEIDVEDPELARMFDDLEKEVGAGAGDEKGKVDDEAEMFHKEFSVLIKCPNEPDQRAVLEELNRHNLDVRALVVDYPTVEKKPPTSGPELAAGEIEIVRKVEVERTARVMQLEGLFDIPPSQRSEQRWRLSVSLDRPWNIGLIVGPSGSGKSTVAKELFGANLVGSWPWSKERAIIDDFPAALGIAEVTGILSSVGFSSPPGWLKPFRVLSNGEQFRVNLARTLAESPELAVVDEFTSVVDRTVARIGSAALAKAIRDSGKKFVAVACHYDIEDWLQPDWKLELPACALTWRLLRRRPEIPIRIRRADAGAWAIFGQHHYLSHNLHAGSQCFLGTVEDRPAAFTAVLHFPHACGGWWREHRTVCHPDFQGVGIGNAMSEFVASLFLATGKEYRSTTSHPAMIRHRLRSRDWRCVRKPSFSKSSDKSKSATAKTLSAYRYTAGFSFIGEPRLAEAQALGVV